MGRVDYNVILDCLPYSTLVFFVTGACGLKSPLCYGRSGAWLVSRGHGTIAAGALLSAIHDQVLLLHHLVCLLHCLRCYSKPLQCAHCSGSHGSSPAGFSCTSCSRDIAIVPVYSVYLNPVLTSWGTSKCVVLGMIFILVGAYGPEPFMQFTCKVTLK